MPPSLTNVLARSAQTGEATLIDGRGKNAIQLRRFNERLVLKALRRLGEGSKSDLAEAAGLTSAAVGGIVNSLQKDGLILMTRKRRDGQRGHPTTLYRLNPEGAYGVGVRLDRTFIETVLINFDGALLARILHDSILPTPEKTLEIVQRDVAKVLEILPGPKKSRLAGIGLAVPFNLNSWLDQLGLPLESFGLWEGFDFAKALRKAVDIPVYSENDGNAAVIAELYYGLGRELDDFLYLFFGPSIGGGVALSGDCLLGEGGNAGDVGLMLTTPSSLPSAVRPKGKWDILLNRTALNSLVRHLRFHGAAIDSAAGLQSVMAEHPQAVDEWLDDCVDALMPPIWGGRAILEAPAVVIDTDAGADFAERLMGKLRDALAASAPEARTPPKIFRGSFGSDAGAIGAASLPIFYSFSPRASILTNGAET
jgi:predicted NBD/HSP70 family sugar kinase